MSRICIISQIWSFHWVIDAQSCLLFAPVFFFSYPSLCEHFQELHWCSQELSRMRKSFSICILLLCASWVHTLHVRAQFHISYGLFPTLQKGLDTTTVTCRNLPGLPWVLVNPSLWWDPSGKSQTRKRTSQDKAGISEFLNPTAQRGSLALFKLPCLQCCSLQTQRFYSWKCLCSGSGHHTTQGSFLLSHDWENCIWKFFGNLNTQGYICSFLQGAELLCWSILDDIAACSALALLILFFIVVSPSFPSKKVGLSFHSFLYFSSTSF